MPQYEIEVGGKRYEVDAPSQDAALAAAQRFSAPPPPNASISAAPERSILERLSDNYGQGDTGPLGAGLKKLTGMANGVSNLIREHVPGVMSTPALERFTRPAAVDTEIRTPGERIGAAMVDTAAYGIPAGKAAQLTQKSGLLMRAAGQAGAAGAVGAAQEGEISGGIVPGVMAGAVPIVGATGGYLKDKLAPRLVQAAVKPTVTALKTQAGASMEGLQAGANRVTKTLLDNKWKSRGDADAAIRAAEKEIQAALAGPSPGTVSPVLDLPTRVPAYMAELEKRAATQLLPKADRGAVSAARQAVLDESPIAQNVTRDVMQPPSFGAQMAGNTAATPAKETARAIRANVTPAEGLELARGTGRQSTKRAYGELKSAEVEAEKTLERATRDSVKAAAPGTKVPLTRQGNAIRVRDIFDRMALRDGNRDVVNSLSWFSPGSVLGHFIKSQQLRGGYLAHGAGKALTGTGITPEFERDVLSLILANAEREREQ